MKELLEVLRVQRHDFMNHLQIISGMIQLNKTDRVFGYIQELSREMSEAGRITALALPEAAAALLINSHRAVKRGVRLQMSISTNLAGCKLTGPAVADIIDHLVTAAVRETCGANCMPGEVFVDIKEEGAGFTLAVSFVCGRDNFTGEHVEPLEELCREKGAGLRCRWAADGKVQLRAEIPKI
ncbi:MAG: Spo0B domain-containing protein [Bacillota bacterium]